MKITILTTSFPEYPGDVAGIFVDRFAQALHRQALQVRVIAPHSPITPKHERFGGVDIHRFQYFFPAKWQRVSYGNGIPANLKSDMWAKIGLLPFLGAFVLQTLRYMNVTDVYHAQWIVSGLAAVAGQSIHRKPVVLTVRGSDLNLFQGKLTQRIFRYVFDRVSLVTTVSEKLRGKILSFGVAPEKVVTLPNGVDSQTFCPEPDNTVRQQSSISPDRSIVLWIGRFISIKGVEFLIQAIPEVVSRAPNTLFVFIGGGELEQEMRRKVEELGITGQTHFTGKIHAREIPGWLQAADVFVLPSLNEGRPNAILEAMACAVPVVATNVGGIPELVTHGKNGLLIPPENSEKLAHALLDILKSPSQGKNMGRAGRQMIFEMGLSWEQCAEQMQQMYRQIIHHTSLGRKFRSPQS